MTTNYKGGKETSELLGVHQRTLYLWEAKGLIETVRTPGNKRLYSRYFKNLYNFTKIYIILRLNYLFYINIINIII